MSIQAADALMGIFGFKRVEKKMNEEEKKAWLEKLRIGKLNAKLNPKPKKPLTWRQAINEKCKDCIYDPLN